jgi:hypothetical protein
MTLPSIHNSRESLYRREVENRRPPFPPTAYDEPPFMSRPRRDFISINGGTDVELTNFSINGGSVASPQGSAILIQNVNGVRITHVDYQNVIAGINIVGCTNIFIEDCRGRNIGNNTIGWGASNYIQFNTSRGGAIRRNRFYGGQTEDMISTWRSGGWGVGNELIIEDNHLEGVIVDTNPLVRRWTRQSGTGIIMSDGTGHAYNGNIIVRRNILLNPGQVGLQHIDGPNLQTYDNIIYAEPYSLNNVPMASWDGTPQGTVTNNRYRFLYGDGSASHPWWHSGSQLTVTGNIHDTTLTPGPLRIRL